MPPAGVGQRDDSEAPVGHREQLGELAVGRPAVPDGADAVHVAQEPANAEGVAVRAAPQLGRRLLHPVQHVGGQDALTAFRAAITKMEPGPAQLVRHRGREAPAGVAAARASPQPPDGQCPVLPAVVPHGEPPGHDVNRREETVR